MTTAPALAITGSTGALGGLVCDDLAARGIPQRLLARTPSRAPSLAGSTVVQADYADHAGARRALDGVQTLLMVSGAESADRLDQHRAFVAAASAAGVEHVVYTSFFGASQDCTFTLGRDHFATEELIRVSGMGFTFLRDNVYLDFLPLLAGDDGVIRGPAGEGRVDETLEEAYASQQRWDAPQWQYDAWVSTYTAIAAGELAGTSDDIERLTGRPPVGLAALLDGPGA